MSTSADKPAESATKLPEKQKTWRVVAKGKPADALKFVDDSPIPKPGKGQLLVKVQAAALNPVGYKLLKWLPGFVLRRIHAHEFDFTGVVVDANGTEFKEGDEIIGLNQVPTAVQSGWGALAQYTKVPASNAVLRPKNVTPTQAAGFPIAGLTAHQALLELGHLQPGQSVFVNGGSTAVGSFAIMIAKALGASVVAASASAKNEAYVRGLGADVFFDYTKAPLHEQLKAAAVEAGEGGKKYDVFLEAVGIMDPTLFVESAAYLEPKGTFLSVGPQGSGFLHFLWKVILQPGILGGTKRQWKIIQLAATKERMEAFAKLVEEGKVKPLVDSVYSFEDTLKAYERLMTSRATGKVIVKVDPTAE